MENCKFYMPPIRHYMAMTGWVHCCPVTPFNCLPGKQSATSIWWIMTMIGIIAISWEVKPAVYTSLIRAELRLRVGLQDLSQASLLPLPDIIGLPVKGTLW